MPMVSVVHFDELGFEYPQHFTRFFKKHTGMQPSKYVASIQPAK